MLLTILVLGLVVFLISKFSPVVEKDLQSGRGRSNIAERCLGFWRYFKAGRGCLFPSDIFALWIPESGLLGGLLSS